MVGMAGGRCGNREAGWLVPEVVVLASSYRLGSLMACLEGIAASRVSIHWAFLVCAAAIRSKWPVPRYLW